LLQRKKKWRGERKSIRFKGVVFARGEEGDRWGRNGLAKEMRKKGERVHAGRGLDRV